jgi:hypothetical protein
MKSTVQGPAERVLAPHSPATPNQDFLFQSLAFDYPDRDLLFIDIVPEADEQFRLVGCQAKAVSLSGSASTDQTVRWFSDLARVAKRHRDEPDREKALAAFMKEYPFRSDLISAWRMASNTIIGEFIKTVLQKMSGGRGETRGKGGERG